MSLDRKWGLHESVIPFVPPVDGKPGTAGNPLRGSVVGPIAGAIGGILSYAGGGSAIVGAINVAVAAGGVIYSSKAAKKAKKEAQQRARRAAAAAAAEAKRVRELQKKNRFKAFSQSQQAEIAPITATVTDPVAPRRLVYGRTRIGGVKVFAGTYTDNTVLANVLVLGDGPMGDLETVWVDDVEVPMTKQTPFSNETSLWLATTGTYTNHLQIAYYDGSAGQLADGFLPTKTNWTSDCKLEGIAYAIVYMSYNLDIYQNGEPNISFGVQGRTDIEDPRTGETGWTDNAALCYAHYLKQEWAGLAAVSTEVDEAALVAAANVCDEMVDRLDGWASAGAFTVSGSGYNSAATGIREGTPVRVSSDGTLPDGLAADTTYFVSGYEDGGDFGLVDAEGAAVEPGDSGSGTHTVLTGGQERRYRASGVVTLDRNPEDVMEDFEAAMAGGAPYISGKYKIYAGQYVAPTVTIDEDWLRGGVKIQKRRGRASRANHVKGVYRAEEALYELTDYPTRTDAAYVTADGARHIRDLPLRMVSSGTQAQRLAEIALRESRNEEDLVITTDLRGLRVGAGSTVAVTLTRHGITARPYHVQTWELAIGAGGEPLVEMTLTRAASSVYDWATTDEIDVLPLAEISTGKPLVSTPTFDPVSGTYPTSDYPKSVAISTTTTDAVIRWSNSASPTGQGDGNAYTGAISVSLNDVVYAKAFKTGFIDSATAIAIYTAEIVDEPVASPVGADYDTGEYPKSITLTCATSGAAIYYTTDGSTPDSGDTLYTGAFNVSEGTTVKAIGIKTDYVDSSIMEETYS